MSDIERIKNATRIGAIIGVFIGAAFMWITLEVVNACR